MDLGNIPRRKRPEYAYYLFKLNTPVANDDPTVGKFIVGVAFNFNPETQALDPNVNCPYGELAQEFGYGLIIARTLGQHNRAMKARVDKSGQPISIVQAQRNILRFKPFLVRYSTVEKE